MLYTQISNLLAFIQMDKINGRLQMLDGHLFFSPNCSRTVALPPTLRDKNGCEHNIFLPSLPPTGRPNYFELDITSYTIPRWWSLPFGWIAFFPLRPSFSGPIFEKLIMPGPYYALDEERNGYSMPSGLCSKWLRVENDLADAVYIIRSHYHSTFIYPLQPSSLGFSRTHRRSGALHMASRKSREWFVVWMALLSFVIAHAEDYYYTTVKDSVTLAKTHWRDLLLDHFDPQWLDALLASTVCSFSPDTPRAGVFLDLSVYDPNRPPPEFFCQVHVPVWYPWTVEMANQSKFAHLAPLPHQLQEGTTFISRSPNPPSPTPLPPSPIVSHPLPAVSTKPKSAWVDFLTRRQKRYEERVQKETPQQQQIRLQRLRNPPKVSAKVFEWVANENGNLVREAVPKKMREDVLGNYPDRQIYYDPIENEYDCCEEYDSGAPGEPFDDNDSDYVGDNSWGDNDVDVGRLSDDRVLSARAPSPDIEIEDNWGSSMTAVDSMSPENFTAEVHRILFLYFGYTPTIPVPQFQNPVLKLESDMQRFVRFLGMTWDDLPLPAFETDQISAAATFVNQLTTKGSSISADIWDLRRENRQSIYFSARLKAVRSVGENLFMFDFDKHSTVKWKLTVTSPAHTLLLCRLDSELDEIGLARYLLENGIPFHTLQASSTLGRSPLSNHPPLVIPTRNTGYKFSWRDYEAFRQQCHVVFKQARGRAALLKGYYPWRLAINDIGFSSALSGPSGWSTKPDEMLVVRLPETGEEFVDDKLTDIELNLISGQYIVSTGMLLVGFLFYFANNSFLRISRSNGVVVLVPSAWQI